MPPFPFSYMHLENSALVESLYAAYCLDPNSVDPTWRYFFEGVAFSARLEPAEGVGLLQTYRAEGHVKAKTNPLAPECKKSDAQEPFVERLERIYCGTFSVQVAHCDKNVREWVYQHREEEPQQMDLATKQRIFHDLNCAELLEVYIHTKYVGQKRFSLEGAEVVIPMLMALLEYGGQGGVEQVVIGMSHRGRLNVLANVLKKSYSMIFGEFEDFFDRNACYGPEDVKYHKGYSATLTTLGGHQIHVSLSANPSHLESVDAVVQGRAYAKQMTGGERTRVLPVVIHGDASLAGQGIVYEVMQLSGLEGYSTGGTLHLVIDNQIGFTTVAKEYRSTQYSTDLALSFGAPIFHINGEDPEACIRAVKLAVELRQKFQCDVFLNLICYRKYGHNESDEPAFTQPQEYARIRSRPTVRELYREHLLQQGAIEHAVVETLEREFRLQLDAELHATHQSKERTRDEAFGEVWQAYHPPSPESVFAPVQTAVADQTLRHIAQTFSKIPEGFTLHPKLQRWIDDRLKRLEQAVDWGLAEHLAFGSLLIEKIPIRLSGQDCCRGTFTQRHAVWVDQATGKRHIPLAHLEAGQGRFDVYNSPLSEFAVLGFEFGYSLVSPISLVLWEAQFGDFANGAQVIIDQYIASSAQKWQRYSGLVLLLPHGYEGQGAEHSSARLERYLQLCAQYNMQVCYPTTPAQYFHLLRRQAKRTIRLPLIVMTPKGLLRYPECISVLSELTYGRFYEILCEERWEATTLLCCTGRIYYDLLKERTKRVKQEIALVRFEQLYPLTEQLIQAMFQHYPHATKVVWVQEEPMNMGACAFIVPQLQKATSLTVELVARQESAVTAAGSHAMHEEEYIILMDKVFI